MSAVILCQVKQAVQPFYVNDAGLNLYSAEELCWFMEHNLPLLDRAFFEEPLQNWLRDELGLDRLAGTLEKLQKTEEDLLLEELVLPVFDEIGWMLPAEEDAFAGKLREQERLSVPARRKIRADSLAGYRKYMMAIRLYRDILNGTETQGQLPGMIWHNMGVCYARMFQMDEAVDCFRRAWDILKGRASLQSLLYCCALRGGQEDFDRMADDCGADMAFRRELEEKLHRLTERQLPSDLDAALKGWVQQYHDETGL